MYHSATVNVKAGHTYEQRISESFSLITDFSDRGVHSYNLHTLDDQFPFLSYLLVVTTIKILRDHAVSTYNISTLLH